MTPTKNRPITKNKGVKTDGRRVDNFQEELRNVINHMGPDSPNITHDLQSSTTDDTHPETTTSIIEIDCDGKAVIQTLIQNPDAKPISVNTPRDYSELSSLVTDSIGVYIDQKSDYDQPHNPGKVDKKISELGLIIRNPIQKLSSILSKSHHNQTNNNHQQQQMNQANNNVDLYRINIHQPKSESAPKRVVFDLVEEPQHCTSNVGTNTTPRTRRQREAARLLYRNANCIDESQQPLLNPSFHMPSVQHRSEPFIDTSSRMQKKTIYQRTSNNKVPGPGHLDSVTRVDVYYFDHGNSAYYHTTDCPPLIMTEIIAEKTEGYTTKFWAEAFGFIHILFSFITSFILQLLRSILQSFIRPLTVGILQIASDYCIKPLLATIFNALIQPPLIFVYNIATSLRDICDPMAEGMGYFIREIAVLFGAMRLIDIKHYSGENRLRRIKKMADMDNDIEQN